MTFLRARAGLGALGSVGLLAIGVVSPAGAIPVPVEGCGDAPEGAALTRTGDVCQVAFTTPGEHEWTVPSGLTAIHAVLTGAGGGAVESVFSNIDRTGVIGYAGSGGSVVYADLTGLESGTTLELSVGRGGTTAGWGEPTSGEETSIGAGFDVEAAAAGGEPGEERNLPCALELPGYDTWLSIGIDAYDFGDDLPECLASVPAGINPGEDDDSLGIAPLALFSGSAAELGRPGGFSVRGDIAPAFVSAGAGTGEGAGAEFSAADGVVFDAAGDAGSVIIRFPAEANDVSAGPEDDTPEADAKTDDTPAADTETDAAPELAKTGADMGPLAALAVTLLGLGGLGLLVRRRAAATAKN